MKVELMQASRLSVIVSATRLTKNSFRTKESLDYFIQTNKIREYDKELLKKILKYEHLSVIEHLIYTFYIKNISRLCLQQLVRHRIASYSVKSTRYTLRRMFKEEITEKNLSKYCNMKYLKEKHEKEHIFTTLLYIKELLKQEKADIVKYIIPDCLLTELFLTINARSFMNLLKLRTSKDAHNEIRELAYKMYDVIPDEHKFLYEGVLYNEESKR